MKFKNILLKLAAGMFVFASCDNSDEELNFDTTVATTDSEFLEIGESKNLINTLTDSSINRFWEITKFQNGTDNLTERFNDVKFVFNNPIVGGNPIESRIEGRIYEPGNLQVNNPDNIVLPTFLFKSSTSSDLIYPFLVKGSSELIDGIITDKEKYDLLNESNESVDDTNPDIPGFKILNDLSANKVTLIRFVNGQEITLILEKRIDTPSTTRKFLQIEENEDLIGALINSDINDFWKITTFQNGADNFTNRFDGVRFVFNNPIVSGNPIESRIEGRIYEPGNLQVNNPDNIVLPTFLFKSSTSSDLIYSFFVKKSSELAGGVITDKEKYDLLNESSESIDDTNPDIPGFKILDDLSANKVTLVRTVNGEEIILILEKE